MVRVATLMEYVYLVKQLIETILPVDKMIHGLVMDQMVDQMILVLCQMFVPYYQKMVTVDGHSDLAIPETQRISTILHVVKMIPGPVQEIMDDNLIIVQSQMFVKLLQYTDHAALHSVLVSRVQLFNLITHHVVKLIRGLVLDQMDEVQILVQFKIFVLRHQHQHHRCIFQLLQFMCLHQYR